MAKGRGEAPLPKVRPFNSLFPSPTESRTDAIRCGNIKRRVSESVSARDAQPDRLEKLFEMIRVIGQLPSSERHVPRSKLSRVLSEDDAKR